MVRRIVLALLGVVLLVGTVYLGVLSAQDPSPVIVASFGLAATFLVPIGFTAVGYAWSAGTPDPLKELVKITEIDKKIAEANTLEERIRLLQDRQTKLTEVIQLETRHQAVLQRKEFLEQQGIRILSDLEAVDQECADLQLVVERTELDEDSRQELEQLRTRLEAKRRGDHVFRFGRHQFTLPGDVERFTFFGGPLVVPLLRIFETAYAVIWRDKRGTVK